MKYRTGRSVRFVVAGALLLASFSASAGLSLNASSTLTTIRSILDGPGLQINNLKISKGIKGQYGVFVGGTDPMGGAPVLGIPDGLFMSTGNTGSILGPNSKSDYTYNTTIQYADPDLTRLSATAVYDPVVIEFDLVPEGDQLNFLLVFGSEEYPEYVCSKFNDVFGLFVSGPGLTGVRNAAFLPDSNYAIAVNNVNSGQPGSKKDGTACQLGNSGYFVVNGNGSGNAGSQLDGFTTPLTTTMGGLQASQSYHVKLAIADAGDQAYDSAAFFKWLTSTSSQLVDLSLTGTPSTTHPDKNGYVDIQYVVKNHSALATRLVEVNINLPAGSSLFSDDSAGRYDPVSGVWTVGNLGAKISKTLNMRVKLGSSASYRIPAEIGFAFNKDPDSTPYNMLARPNEDDTSIIVLSPISNKPPEITNNAGAASFSLTIPENGMGPIIDYQALDPEGETEGTGLTWSLGGGTDDHLFQVTSTGVLSPKAPPDFESPMDADKNNECDTILQVCDSYGSCATQKLKVIISDVLEDADGDGLGDQLEDAIGSNPNSPDSDNDGVDDKTEFGTSPDTPRDSDGDGTADILDTDDDNDGIATVFENYNGGTALDDDTDQDGKADYLDSDDDNDGILTINENYNGKTPTDDDTDQDGIADYLDADDDGDSVPTLAELEGPSGAATDTDADGLPNYLDSDDDNDTVPTLLENHNGGSPLDDDTDADGLPDYLDTDDDDDTLLTRDENYNGGSPDDDDTDADGKPDYVDRDDDGDGLLTRQENYNGGSPLDDDTDADGKPDYRDADDDGDGKPSAQEGNDPNGNMMPEDASDTDGDGTPDYLDRWDQYDPAEDNDNDGITNGEELEIGSNPDNPDSDGDGLPDSLEIGLISHPLDSDHDGIPNLIDPDDDGDSVLTRIENKGNSSPVIDFDKDGIFDMLDVDDDNDGMPTVGENYNGGTPEDDDSDGDGKPDYLDADDDNDTISTWYENYNGNTPADDDTDKDGKPDYLDVDDDNDGLLTRHEQPDPNGNGNPDDGRDFDKDGLHDYLDADDDGDGRLTIDEKADPNGDMNPQDAADDDLDSYVDYLDPEITPYVRVRVRAMLQGPYDYSTGLMRDKPRSLGYLPAKQPYDTLSNSFGYTNSPYAASPFGYPGNEAATAEFLEDHGNDSAVDWVLVQVRDANDPTRRLSLKAAMLQRDGDIVDVRTGSADLVMHGVSAGRYYVAINHRNHLGVMSRDPVALSATATAVDFTLPATPVYGGNDVRINMPSVSLLIAGDVNNSGTVINTGSGSDVNVILGALLISPNNAGVNSSFKLPGYFATDVNLDGNTIYAGKDNDANLIIGNVLMHADNPTMNANFVVQGGLPSFK